MTLDYMVNRSPTFSLETKYIKLYNSLSEQEYIHKW